DMTPQLQSRLEKDGYTLERESQSGVWEVSRSISNQEIKSADMENSDNLFKKIRDASKKVLSTFLGKTSKNNIDGREVKFTKRSLDKMTSGSAVGKSLDNGFTREEHYEAAQNILEIFKTAKFVETQPPKNGSLDILGVHKYMGEYKNANVKITIKEIKEHGNTFYSIELMELLSRDMQSGDPKTGNLDNTAIIHTDEEPPRPRTSSPYNANSKTIPNQSIKEAENLTQYRKDIEAKYNIRPIKEFGTNYAEFYHDGKGAINKLLVEKQGQVAGAFEREGLGDIDLVWGEFEVVKGDIKGYGLSKIEAKHLNDFAIFEGNTPQEKMANGIAEIIEKGEIKIDNNSRTTIVYNKNDKVYKIGLKQNWKGNPTENKWIVTAYDDIREANKIINSKGFTKGETLPLNSSGNSTTTAIKSQELNLSRAERRAMGIEEPKGKTLVIDEKAVKNDVREFGRLAHQVGLGFKSAKEAKAVMDKCDKSKFDCGS
ncbi:MAG: DUF3519 domain-containing protein, partial [Campylobacter sp.]|nr:DUF3519 domain-containing protein [Campylobacter sp.]